MKEGGRGEGRGGHEQEREGGLEQEGEATSERCGGSESTYESRRVGLLDRGAAERGSHAQQHGVFQLTCERGRVAARQGRRAMGDGRRASVGRAGARGYGYVVCGMYVWMSVGWWCVDRRLGSHNVPDARCQNKERRDDARPTTSLAVPFLFMWSAPRCRGRALMMMAFRSQ